MRELWAIEVTGAKITTTDIGPIKTGCATLAMSPSGTLLSMCGTLFGTQQLTSFDTKTGLATLFGVPVPGLAVMAMAFGPDGTLYAVGGCYPNGDPNDLNTDCSSSDPNFNSLYTVNEVTGDVYPHRFNGRSSILYGPGVRSSREPVRCDDQLSTLLMFLRSCIASILKPAQPRRSLIWWEVTP